LSVSIFGAVSWIRNLPTVLRPDAEDMCPLRVLLS
jgi:hypothetical protein